MSSTLMTKWFSEDEGATASEYAVMLALIIAALVVSISAVGNSTQGGWSKNYAAVSTACNGS